MSKITQKNNYLIIIKEKKELFYLNLNKMYIK